MKFLTPYDVANLTGLSYPKALMLVKGMPFIRIENRYYVTDEKLKDFLAQDTPIEIFNTNEED